MPLVCTEFQVLDMTDTELSHLARHMGHDPKTHRDFYRLSHSTVQLSQVLIYSLFGLNLSSY